MIATALDIILALVIVEGVALTALHGTTGRGIAPRNLLGTLAAGFFLMLAVRLAVGGAGDGPIAASLLGSLVAHLADLAIRWRRA